LISSYARLEVRAHHADPSGRHGNDAPEFADAPLCAKAKQFGISKSAARIGKVKSVVLA